jgi:hypothetical protein
MHEVYQDIYESQFIEEIFKDNSKIKRSEFISKLSGDGAKFLNPTSIKAMVLAK